MNRLKQAWQALCGTLEPERVEVVREVPVIGEASKVRLFRASANRYSTCYGETPKWNGNLYLSCEQAHSECPGADVSVVECMKIGGTYFTIWGVADPQPKPKIAKGERRG